jgi:hypothetical protein
MELIYHDAWLTMLKYDNDVLCIESSAECREAIEEMQLNGKRENDIITDVFECFCGNGGCLLTPEEIGGLTSCNLIVGWGVVDEKLEVDVSKADVWWYADYQIHDTMEKLKTDGELYLQYAPNYERKEEEDNYG